MSTNTIGKELIFLIQMYEFAKWEVKAFEKNNMLRETKNPYRAKVFMHLINEEGKIGDKI